MAFQKSQVGGTQQGSREQSDEYANFVETGNHFMIYIYIYFKMYKVAYFQSSVTCMSSMTFNKEF